MVQIFSSEQKLTGGISFTMQFPMATVKKNALHTGDKNCVTHQPRSDLTGGRRGCEWAASPDLLLVSLVIRGPPRSQLYGQIGRQFIGGIVRSIGKAVPANMDGGGRLSFGYAKRPDLT
jgi:hypothetical protein